MYNTNDERTTSIDTACLFASKGYSVFPLKAGSKVPAIKRWQEVSSCSEAKILKWAQKLPGCNWAVDCGESGLLVVDVDVRDGKPGMASLRGLEKEIGHLEGTYRVRTPSGGVHIYYRGDGRTTAQTCLGEGIDTRGKGGYVVLAGSLLENEDTPYEVVVNAPIAELPKALKQLLLKTPDDKELEEVDGLSLLSDEEVLALAENDPKFQKLFGGDFSEYPSQSEADLALVRRLAYYTGCDQQQMDRLFQESALYREKWDRPDYKRRTLLVACQSAKRMHSEHHEVDLDFGAPVFAATSCYEQELVSGENLGVRLPVPRKWIFKGKGGLSRNIIGCIAGQGGCGKTQFILQVAASVASGIDCLGIDVEFQVQGPVLMVLAEDELEEIDRRIYRLRQEVGDIDLSQLYVFSRGGDPRILERGRDKKLFFVKGFTKLCDVVARIKPVLIVLDSLSVIAGEAEENNSDAAFVISQLTRLCELGDEATVLLLTHVTKASVGSKGGGTKKYSASQQIEAALDPISVRGASALVNNCRWVMTSTMLPKEARRKLGAVNKDIVAVAIRKTNYSEKLDLAHMENHRGYLYPFGPDRKVAPEKIVIELLVNAQPASKTQFVTLCGHNERLPTKTECAELIQDMIDTGKILEKARRGRGGGKVLSLASMSDDAELF